MAAFSARCIDRPFDNTMEKMEAEWKTQSLLGAFPAFGSKKAAVLFIMDFLD